MVEENENGERKLEYIRREYPTSEKKMSYEWVVREVNMIKKDM